VVAHAIAAWVSLDSGGMQIWELDRLRVAAHHPQILRSDEGANRVIALLLPQGECLQGSHRVCVILRCLMSEESTTPDPV
jgi:hypothetical protein